MDYEKELTCVNNCNLHKAFNLPEKSDISSFTFPCNERTLKGRGLSQIFSFNKNGHTDVLFAVNQDMSETHEVPVLICTDPDCVNGTKP